MGAKITVTQMISADVETVWGDVADVASHVEWMADAESITFLTEERSGTGTTIEVLTRVGPFSTTDVMTFTAWEPPHRMAVEHRGLVTGSGEFTLERVGNETRFVWSEELAFPLYLGGRLGASIGRHVLAAIWRRNLRTLARRFA